MNIGKRMRERRKELNLTQEQLARALGVTPQHISVIEQDKRAPSLSSLARLAEELGVTTDYLITGKEGVITNVIPALKADKNLSLKTKKALIGLVEELYTTRIQDKK
jgi:transcriptional regulator with XRE-family HTH domain